MKIGSWIMASKSKEEPKTAPDGWYNLTLGSSFKKIHTGNI